LWPNGRSLLSTCLFAARFYVVGVVLFYNIFIGRASVVCLSVCLSCPVCNVGVLWPNGWMDQDETWHTGRPRPQPHCVGWGPSSRLPQRAQHRPQFSAYVCCGQTAGWIKMPLGKEVGLGQGDIVLDGDSALPPQRGTAPIFGPCLLWPNGWMDQDATWWLTSAQAKLY